MHPNVERVQNAGRALALMSYMAKSELALPAPIDEVSLLFSTTEELDAFVSWAKTAGAMEHFNTVDRDTVICAYGDWWAPVVTEAAFPPMNALETFDVRYEFVRLPGADWRIEAMCVLNGKAPLHEAWLESYGEGCVVHTSYKLPNEGAYRAHVSAGPHGALWQRQPTLRASYANSYGAFTYYQHPEFTDKGFSWLLKPRVNLRDNQPIARRGRVR